MPQLFFFFLIIWVLGKICVNHSVQSFPNRHSLEVTKNVAALNVSFESFNFHIVCVILNWHFTFEGSCVGFLFDTSATTSLCCLLSSLVFSLTGHTHTLTEPLMSFFPLHYQFVEISPLSALFVFPVNDRHPNFPSHQRPASLLCDHSNCHKTGENISTWWLLLCWPENRELTNMYY